ncbi:hypothetical protein ACSSV6_002745, partial [Roseovarius sp. MBR-38]
SSNSLDIVIVLTPLKKHGPKRSYTEDRTLSPAVFGMAATLEA